VTDSSMLVGPDLNHSGKRGSSPNLASYAISNQQTFAPQGKDNRRLKPIIPLRRLYRRLQSFMSLCLDMCSTNFDVINSDVTAEFVALLFPIRDVSGSNHSHKICVRSFSRFALLSPDTNVTKVAKDRLR
jgi:hypothetical protein